MNMDIVDVVQIAEQPSAGEDALAHIHAQGFDGWVKAVYVGIPFAGESQDGNGPSIRPRSARQQVESIYKNLASLAMAGFPESLTKLRNSSITGGLHQYITVT